MGALKGHFQSLQGLQVKIKSNEDHKKALQWVTIAIIPHNLIIDIKGYQSGVAFAPLYTRAEEFEDQGEQDAPLNGDGENDGELKHTPIIILCL